jgi:hypothetical protein
MVLVRQDPEGHPRVHENIEACGRELNTTNTLTTACLETNHSLFANTSSHKTPKGEYVYNL